MRRGKPGMRVQKAEAWKLVATLKLLVATWRYRIKHCEIFTHDAADIAAGRVPKPGFGYDSDGKYTYGVPPEIDIVKEGLDMSFRDWLEANDLGAMMPFFIYSQARSVRVYHVSATGSGAC